MMKNFKNTLLNMNDDLLLKLEEDNIQLKKTISEKMKNSSLTPASSSWINGILNVLDSKVIIKSTIDDLQWFHNYGMAGCKRILDIGCGAGYISLMISRMGKDVIGYEFIGKWVGQEHKESDYYESFSFTHNCVKQIAMTNGGRGGHLNFNFYQSFPLDISEASIDCVVMYAVMEHLDPSIIVPFFSELRRILKPKGLLFIAKLPRKLSYQEHLAHFLRIPSR